MKVEIDFRPTETNNLARQTPFYAIRLYPETNKEMADLERAISIRQQPVELKRNCFDYVEYAIIFKETKSIEEEIRERICKS